MRCRGSPCVEHRTVFVSPFHWVVFGRGTVSHIFHHSQLAEWASKSGYCCKDGGAFVTRSVVYAVGILDDLTHDYYMVLVQQLQLLQESVTVLLRHHQAHPYSTVEYTRQFLQTQA